MRGLIIVSLKVLGICFNNNEELIIVRRGFMIFGSIFFRSLDGIGFNIYVVGLDDLISLYNFFFFIVENEWNCFLGGL